MGKVKSTAQEGWTTTLYRIFTLLKYEGNAIDGPNYSRDAAMQKYLRMGWVRTPGPKTYTQLPHSDLPRLGEPVRQPVAINTERVRQAILLEK